MDFKKMFDDAFSELEKDAVYISDEGFFALVRERAAKAEENDRYKAGGHVRVAGPLTEKKRRKAPVIAAAAAAVCVIAAGVGLAVRGDVIPLPHAAQGTDEGVTGTAVAATMPVAAGEEFVSPTAAEDPWSLPDIYEAIGRAVEFHDASVTLRALSCENGRLNALFDVRCTGSDTDSYSPEYLKLEMLDDTADDTDFECTFEPVEASDANNFVCSYSAPVSIGAGETCRVSIQYLSRNVVYGANIQGIEADRQHYRLTYTGSTAETEYEFGDCTVRTLWRTFDGLTLKIGYNVMYKYGAPERVTESGVSVTCPYNENFAMTEIVTRTDERAYAVTAFYLMQPADKCDILFSGEGGSYVLTADKTESAGLFSSDLDSELTLENGTLMRFRHVYAGRSAIVFLCDVSTPYTVDLGVTVRLSDGTELKNPYPPQQGLETSGRCIRFALDSIDPAALREIYVNGSCIYGSNIARESSEHISGEASFTVPMRQEITFTDPHGGVWVRFMDYFFDEAVLKVHYEAEFPSEIPEEPEKGTQRILPVIEGLDETKYAWIRNAVTDRTGNTLTFEAVCVFFERQSEVTLMFDDTSMSGEDMIPFVLKCPENAAKSIIICDRPHEYTYMSHGKDTADLERVEICPSAMMLTFRLYGGTEYEMQKTLLELGDKTADMRVALHDGRDITDALSPVLQKVQGDTAVITVTFGEVTDPYDVRSIFIDSVSVYGEYPRSGYIGAGLVFGFDDCDVVVDSYYYDGLKLVINYLVKMHDDTDSLLTQKPFINPQFVYADANDRGYIGRSIVWENDDSAYYMYNMITLRPLKSFDITFSGPDHTTDSFFTVEQMYDCLSDSTLRDIPLSGGGTAKLTDVYVSASTVEAVFSGTEGDKLTSDDIPEFLVIHGDGQWEELVPDENSLFADLKTGKQYLRCEFADPSTGNVEYVYSGGVLVYGTEPFMEGGLVPTEAAQR